VTSLLVSLLIVLFLPLRPLLRRAIGSQWLCVLWLAVLARLLMPWAVESRWSLFSRWQSHAAPVAAVAQEPVTIKVKVLENAAPESGNTASIAPALRPPRPPHRRSPWRNIIYFLVLRLRREPLLPGMALAANPQTRHEHAACDG